MACARHILVIGYGNELRTDDGSGPRIASAIEELGLPGVQVLTVQQLTPELADPICRADAVVFIDAAVGTSAGVEVEPVSSHRQVEMRGHFCEPALLLGLARLLFANCPPAWLIKVPAFDLSVGENLTRRAQANIAAAVSRFEALRSSLLAPACGWDGERVPPVMELSGQ